MVLAVSINVPNLYRGHFRTRRRETTRSTTCLHGLDTGREVHVGPELPQTRVLDGDIQEPVFSRLCGISSKGENHGVSMGLAAKT